ncbi:hypothetical protein ACWF99_12545 [Nocardia sp. NPDC055002]
MAAQIGHGTGAGYFGKRLASVLDDPSRIDPAVRGKLKDVQRELFGCDMLLTQSAFFSVDPDDPEHSVNFPFHQEHGSYYDFREHLRYTNLYMVLDKADPTESNVTIIPFSELAAADQELHTLAVGSGAARYTGRTRLDDDSGSSVQFQADLEVLAHTPLLSPGDLLLLRGDIIHRTQNQKCRRTAISIRSVAPDVVCHREQFEKRGGQKLAFMLSDLPYYGGRDYIFEMMGKDRMSAQQLQSARGQLTKAGSSPALDKHIASFSAKLKELQRSLRMDAAHG